MSDHISIIGGGWSASQFDLSKAPGLVIAVNDAALFAPRWDICVSMDRLWTENRWKMIASKCHTKDFWLRRSTLINVKPATDWKRVFAFENDHQSAILSEAKDPPTLNGTSSGMCAINLAYQMKPRWLYLYGFDMQFGPRGERHWWPDPPWGVGTGPMRLAEWAMQMAICAKQLKAARIRTMTVANLRRDTRIDDFESVDRRQIENIWTVSEAQRLRA